MKRTYYETPKASWLMRLFWKAAGGDRYILERATYSDQIKYMCLGGIIIATGVMAGLAGGYAFYTIFEPKGDALDSIVMANNITDRLNYIHLPSVIKATVFGIFWGLIIFNIDRFIVTSTGKGDGTEAITWDEFKGAIPRIIMGTIIAITISSPIEIRMFKTEIDVKLHDIQQQAELKFKDNNSKITSPEINRIDNELAKIDALDKQLMQNEEIARKDLRDCLMKLGGDCPRNTQLYNSAKTERENYENNTKSKIVALEQKKSELQGGKEHTDATSKKISAGLDGLLERIKISHEIAGFWISFFVTLLFMAIELTPIFFKLMLTKTPYDYIAENRDDLIRAEHGIEVKYDYYQDKQGVERHLVVNHEAERMIYEKIKTTEIQKTLTDYAIGKYLEREQKKIDENLDEYIKSIKPEDINNNEEKEA